MVAHALLAFFFLQLSQNGTIPQGVGGHTPLGTGVLGNCSFYWHYSGFDDNNMCRLKQLKINFKNILESKVKMFDRLHSGFSNDGNDRLQRKTIILKACMYSYF